jgi:membrane protease YdiL (CAAX protease family)
MLPVVDGLALTLGIWVLLIRPVQQRLRWPREIDAMKAPGGRLRRYRRAIVSQWTLAGLALAYALHAGVAPADPHGPQLALGLELRGPPLAVLGLAVLLTGLYARPLLALRGPDADELRDEVRRQFDALSLTPLLPHTAAEYRAFLGLALTAGLCEELLYRGVLHGIAARHGVPVAAAAVGSTLLFAWAHQYQGARGLGRTLIVGAVFCGLVVLSGSLWPAVLLHAGIDVISGSLAYATLGARGALPPSPERVA